MLLSKDINSVEGRGYLMRTACFFKFCLRGITQCASVWGRCLCLRELKLTGHNYVIDCKLSSCHYIEHVQIVGLCACLSPIICLLFSLSLLKYASL